MFTTILAVYTQTFKNLIAHDDAKQSTPKSNMNNKIMKSKLRPEREWLNADVSSMVIIKLLKNKTFWY